jgi:hypothetical protein
VFVAQQSISYLGYVISGARVAINPKKIVAVANWSVPKSVKEHRGFLGLEAIIGNLFATFTSASLPSP